MVWFQCDDCGEEVKKPKLSNHFRICSASKLSCIDCGVTFGPDSVQGHTQCITEAEKYGPKGVGKPAVNGATPKSKDSKPKPDVDINVGLSLRPPWTCSLCNTKATSKQALLLHAGGKKHRAKARAFHAGKQPKQVEENGQFTGNGIVPKALEEQKTQDRATSDGLKLEDVFLPSEKKRKLDVSDSDGNVKKVKGDVTQVGSVKIEEIDGELKNVKPDGTKDDEELEGDNEKNINWKKLIKAALKSNPDGGMKLRKLKKQVQRLLQESGKVVDQDEMFKILEQKVTSNSRFTLNGKYVRLVAKA
ncbi:UBP1-associated proteins 1C [Linum perenne]